MVAHVRGWCITFILVDKKKTKKKVKLLVDKNREDKNRDAFFICIYDDMENT